VRGAVPGGRASRELRKVKPCAAGFNARVANRPQRFCPVLNGTLLPPHPEGISPPDARRWRGDFPDRRKQQSAPLRKPILSAPHRELSFRGSAAPHQRLPHTRRATEKSIVRMPVAGSERPGLALSGRVTTGSRARAAASTLALTGSRFLGPATRVARRWFSAGGPRNDTSVCIPQRARLTPFARSGCGGAAGPAGLQILRLRRPRFPAGNDDGAPR
jgi:hypothetical protein